MKKVIVTGGLGLLGFSLVKSLLEEGIYVIVVDALTDFRREELARENVLWVGRNSLFQHVEKTIEAVQWEKLLDDVDTVFHLAQLTKEEETLSARDVACFLRGTEKMGRACANRQIPIIYTSSYIVYGQRFGLMDEEAPLAPESKQAHAKVAEERLLYQIYKRNHLPVTIFRLAPIKKTNGDDRNNMSCLPRGDTIDWVSLNSVISLLMEAHKRSEKSYAVYNVAMPDVSEAEVMSCKMKRLCSRMKTEKLMRQWSSFFILNEKKGPKP